MALPSYSAGNIRIPRLVGRWRISVADWLVREFPSQYSANEPRRKKLERVGGTELVKLLRERTIMLYSPVTALHRLHWDDANLPVVSFSFPRLASSGIDARVGSLGLVEEVLP